jgi:hypothetical protein
VRTRQLSTISTIQQQNGILVYGEEVPVSVEDRWQKINRAIDERSFSLLRKEFSVREIDSGVIKKGWWLAVAALPASRRCVAVTMIKPRLRSRGGAKNIEDLGIGATQEMPPEDVVTCIERHDTELLEMGPYYTASLSFGFRRIGEILPWPRMSEQQAYPGRWSQGAHSISKDGWWAIGAFPWKVDEAKARLWSEPKIRRLFELKRVRAFRGLKGRGAVREVVKLSNRIQEHVPDLIEHATQQALAGWGDNAKAKTGCPVSDHIWSLVQDSLLNLLKREAHVFADERGAISYDEMKLFDEPEW